MVNLSWSFCFTKKVVQIAGDRHNLNLARAYSHTYREGQVIELAKHEVMLSGKKLGEFHWGALFSLLNNSGMLPS